MTLQIILSIVLIILASVLDSQRDKIQFDPLRSWFSSWRWWTVRNYMEKKYPLSRRFDDVLSFANDGWHFCKSMSLVCIFTAGILLLGLPWYFTAGLVLLVYILYGAIFTIAYKYL